MTSELASLARDLLPDTLRLAARHPLYRSLWRLSDVADAGELSLEQLPVLRKDWYWQHYEQELELDDDHLTLARTTGTSSGASRFRYWTSREPEAAELFARGVDEELPPVVDPGRPIPVIVSLQSRLQPMRDPRRDRPKLMFSCSTAPPWALERTIDMLRKTFPSKRHERRASTLMGPISEIMRLTFALERRGLSGRDFEVRSMWTTSEYLTRETRAFLERWWGASIVHTYSMAELNPAAHPCEGCDGRYHFFDPDAIGELLDPFTQRPVESGLAVLVVTELAPFMQTLPLIRYWTDDLVEAHPPACHLGLPSFTPKGRLPFALVDADAQEIPLTPGEIGEALGAIPDIVRVDVPGYEPGETENELSPYGRLSYSATLGPPGTPREIAVELQLSYSVAYFAEAAARVCKTAHARLLEESPRLRRLVASGRHRLSVRATNRRLSMRSFGGAKVG